MGKFSEKVYKIIKKIPKGKVVTYSQVAKLIGAPKSTRAVGQALKKNPAPIVVPCHRVVDANGLLGGYAKGIDEKKKLLKSEGVVIKNGKINLEKYGAKLQTSSFNNFR